MNQNQENQSSEYSTLLLDLDGTLIDSYRGIEWSLHHALERILPACPRVPLRALVGPPLREMIRQYLVQHMGDELTLGERATAVEALVPVFREYYDAEGSALCEPYPNVESTLQILNDGGIRKIIVTNKPARPSTIILERLGWGDYFDAVISPDTVLPNFPEKIDSTRYAVHHFNLIPGETLFVGDSADDALAASHNALDFAAILYGYGVAGEYSARYQIEDFGELLLIAGLEKTVGVVNS